MIDISKFRKVQEHEVEEFAYAMNTRGFAVVENYMDEETCEFLKERLVQAIKAYQPKEGSVRSKLDAYLIHDLLCKDVTFAKLLEDPNLQRLVATLLDNYWIMYAFTSSSLPPQGNNYGSRLHVDSPRFIPNYPTNIGVIWALDEFTTDNGGTKLLPGSHNSSKAPSEEYFERNCMQLTCPKGSFIAFNARVWHRAGYNTTDQWRHSLTMNVCRPYMKQRMDWVRFIPEAISSQLNDQARRIIGFDTRLPTSLEEFFTTEDNRLYKANQE